jgi:phage protein D
MTELAYAVAAPVFEVDGQTTGSLGRDLLKLEIEETTAGLKTLRARVLNVGPRAGEAEELLYLDGSVLDFGKKLQVALGPPDDERIVFQGRISALEADFKEGREPQLSVFAEDALMKLRMTRRTKAYEQMTDADIASAIASEHGLTPATAADGPSYDVVHQLNMSDLAFLRERAQRVRAELWADDETLNFKTRPNRTGTTLTLVQGNELIAAQLRADLAHQRSKVKVSGYDADARDVIEEEAGSDAIQAEVSGGESGPAVLTRALGERVSHRMRDVPLVAGEATAWAKAELLRRARAFLTVVGTTSGSPSMVVGSLLTLERVGGPFEGGGWYVTRVRHTYEVESGTGHRTHFEAERPTLAAG